MELKLYGKKIWIHRSPIDFRKSIDGLSHFIVQQIKHKPGDGIYLFYNRNADKIKCLSWHKNGFVLLYKRLEKGRFSMVFNRAEGVMEMDAQELSWLLAGLEWQKMRNWRELNYGKFC